MHDYLDSRPNRARRRQVTLFVVAAIVVAGVAAVVAGGVGGPASPSGDQRPGWSALPEPPIEPRTNPAVSSLDDDSVAIVGGRSYLPDDNSYVVHADGALYDVGERRWTQLPPLPQPLEAPAAADADGRLVIIGVPCQQFDPEDGDCSPGGYASYVYDSAADVWEETPLPAAAQPSDDRMEQPPPARSHAVEGLAIFSLGAPGTVIATRLNRPPGGSSRTPPTRRSRFARPTTAWSRWPIAIAAARTSSMTKRKASPTSPASRRVWTPHLRRS